MPMTRRSTALLLLAAALAGCAGYRGGWDSVPYVGDTPPVLEPARTAFEARQRRELALPGLRLGVDLNNQTRTHDTQVMLVAVPVSVDPRTVPVQPAQPGRTRVSLLLSPLAGPVTVRPKQARLSVGGRVSTAAGGNQFGMWDAQGRLVDSGGRWEHRPLGEEATFAPRDRAWVLNLDFAVTTPSPESRDVVLDLSQAVVVPGQPALPPIRFTPVRWKEGYT